MIKYRIRCVESHFTEYYPQMRKFGLWFRVPEYIDGSGSASFPNLAAVEQVINNHKRLYDIKTFIRDIEM